MTKHSIFNTDSRHLDFVPDKSVNLIVTSPPYPMIEMWDSMFIEQDESIGDSLKKADGYASFNKMHNFLNIIWKECDRVLADSGFICINIGDATRTLNGQFQMYPNHSKVVEQFVNMGYSVLPDIHWRKPSNAPNKFMGSGMYPAGAYVTYEHEYILIFRKGGKRAFNNEERAARQRSAYFWEERNSWFSDIWEIKGASQAMNNVSDRSRNASFPFEIPYRLVNMYSIEGDTVLDPFCGLGTTNLACMAANRNSIGSEISEEISTLARNRLLSSESVLNNVIFSRLSSHIDFINSIDKDKQNKCYLNQNHNFLVKTKQETAILLSQIKYISAEDDAIVCDYRSV